MKFLLALMILLVEIQIEEVEVEAQVAQIAEVQEVEDDEVELIVGNILYFLKSQERQCTALSFFCYFLLIFYLI